MPALALPRPLAAYWTLVKPGIVWSNTLTAAAGFLFAARGALAFGTLAAALAGIALIIASACAVNNWLDREIDAAMPRTKHRPLVSGAVSERGALFFAGILLALGMALLAALVNGAALAAALLGFIIYVGPYTLAKRATPFGMHVGTLAGAMPPVMGYFAAAGAHAPLLPALMLFLVLALWQMPHFLAISLFRAEEYAAAGIPVYPLRFGFARAKLLIMLYTAAFALAALLPYALEHAGARYEMLALFAGFGWLAFELATLKRYDSRAWARRVFFASLIALLAWCAAAALAAL